MAHREKVVIQTWVGNGHTAEEFAVDNFARGARIEFRVDGSPSSEARFNAAREQHGMKWFGETVQATG